MFRWIASVVCAMALSASATTLETKVEVWHPMAKALDLCAKKVMEETGARAEDMYWSSVTEDMKVLHRPFMNLAFRAWGDPVIEGLPAIAGETAEVNQFLREQGFTIQLDERPAAPGSRKISAAAVLKTYPRWKETGKETSVTYQGKEYPAVHLKGGVEVFTWDWDESVSVARVATDGPEVFYLIKASDIEDVETLVSSSPFSLTTWAKRISTKAEMTPNPAYQGVVFPKIKLDREERLEWLKGLTIEFEGIGGDPWRITEALVQNRLALDEKGALIESAAAVSGSKTTIKDIAAPLVIDEPFILVVFREDEEGRREGSGIPLLAAYIDFSQE